jgi:hypothetical protein
MVFLADGFAAWLAATMADAGRKKLSQFQWNRRAGRGVALGCHCGDPGDRPRTVPW